MNSNETNVTDTTNYNSLDVSLYMLIYYTLAIIIYVCGTLINIWFLAAILSSQDMRSRLRNKLICNTIILHLVDGILVMPIATGSYLSGSDYNCVLQTALDSIRQIQDFIGNWLLVMLIVVFIAQIQDFNPGIKLTPRAVIVGTIGLLTFPWIVSIIVVPITTHEIYYKVTGIRGSCFPALQDAITIFKYLDTVLPILLAVILLAVAAVLRYRRFTSGSMQIELINRGPEIDNTFAYVTAVVVSILCDFLQIIVFIGNVNLYRYGLSTMFTMYAITFLLADLRVVLMPLTWLLLTDVRQRIKTWRPWYRPAAGIDLTVTYSKEDN
uniref:G-protein coupled receptors family 1 profile domain-containing protein n=1 Tax=Arion vulgaris TaxID=1028688 RepID=A0A0B7BJK5_9EUPU